MFAATQIVNSSHSTPRAPHRMCPALVRSPRYLGKLRGIRLAPFESRPLLPCRRGSAAAWESRASSCTLDTRSRLAQCRRLVRPAENLRKRLVVSEWLAEPDELPEAFNHRVSFVRRFSFSWHDGGAFLNPRAPKIKACRRRLADGASDRRQAFCLTFLWLIGKLPPN